MVRNKSNTPLARAFQASTSLLQAVEDIAFSLFPSTHSLVIQNHPTVTSATVPSRNIFGMPLHPMTDASAWITINFLSHKPSTRISLIPTERAKSAVKPGAFTELSASHSLAVAFPKYQARIQRAARMYAHRFNHSVGVVRLDFGSYRYTPIHHQ